MEQVRRLTAVIERKDDVCTLHFAPSSTSPVKALRLKRRANLIEALTLFFETADQGEIQRRGHSAVFVTQVEVPVG